MVAVELTISLELSFIIHMSVCRSAEGCRLSSFDRKTSTFHASIARDSRIPHGFPHSASMSQVKGGLGPLLLSRLVSSRTEAPPTDQSRPSTE
jgi:hypothetical protein